MTARAETSTSVPRTELSSASVSTRSATDSHSSGDWQIEATTLKDILEPDRSVPLRHFLTKPQWKMLKDKQEVYRQVHVDGTGLLLCRENTIAACLVRSYHKSFKKYSQLVVEGVGAADLGRDLREGELKMLLDPEEEERRAEIIREKCRHQQKTGGSAVEPHHFNLLPRFFTPRECARLQGFPESFKLPGDEKVALLSVAENMCQEHKIPEEGTWYQQIGNAVAPPVVAAVCWPLGKFFEQRWEALHGTKKQPLGSQLEVVGLMLANARPKWVDGSSWHIPAIDSVNGA